MTSRYCQLIACSGNGDLLREGGERTEEGIKGLLQKKGGGGKVPAVIVHCVCWCSKQEVDTKVSVPRSPGRQCQSAPGGSETPGGSIL